jgi:hypothetical protein
MSLGANGQLLMALTKELALKWEQAKESWRDAKSEEFERKYLGELMTSVNKAGEVVDQLNKVVTKARSDCE